MNPCLLVRPVAEIGYNLESVALINQVLLALGRVEHFLGICTHKSVKEGIEGRTIASILLRVRLGTENTTEALCLLTS